MTYDFTSIMNRHGMDSIAVDGLGTDPGFAPDPPREGFDVIPMWVADMNFPTVPTIPQAIIERAKHPAYGYFSPTDDYYSSIIDWQSTRNGVTGLTREAIGYENGVLGGVISALTAFAAPGDGVLLHSPTYIGFTRSIENNGYRIVHSPLTLDERGAVMRKVLPSSGLPLSIALPARAFKGVAARAIDPTGADLVLRDPAEAEASEIEDEKLALAKISAGVEPLMIEGQNHAARLQALTEGVQVNPQLMQRYQSDEIFRALIDARVQHHQHQVQQQENAVIGRMGAPQVLTGE